MDELTSFADLSVLNDDETVGIKILRSLWYNYCLVTLISKVINSSILSAEWKQLCRFGSSGSVSIPNSLGFFREAAIVAPFIIWLLNAWRRLFVYVLWYLLFRLCFTEWWLLNQVQVILFLSFVFLLYCVSEFGYWVLALLFHRLRITTNSVGRGGGVVHTPPVWGTLMFTLPSMSTFSNQWCKTKPN